MSLRIRRARPTDADGIARVEVESWRDTYPTLISETYLVGRLDVGRMTENWRRRLRGDGRNTLVAEEPGQAGGIVGYTTWGRSRISALPPAGQIFELYLLPGHQERGIGRRLCTGAGEHLIEAGQRSMYVEVLDGNPSRFFYESLGARLVARGRHPFAGDHLPSLVYAWDDIAVLVGEEAR